MIRSKEFLLRQVAGKQVLVPVGAAAVAFPGMVNMNMSGSYLWELLEQPRTMDFLVQSILDEYDVAQEIARLDVEKFIQKLASIHAIIL